MKKNFHRAKSVIILLCLFLVWQALPSSTASNENLSEQEQVSDTCGVSQVEEEKSYRGYRARIWRSDDGYCHFITIEKDGHLLYRHDEIGGHFYFGPDLKREANPFLSVTGKDRDNLVYTSWTGGAHCCFTLHVFDLTYGFEEVAHIDGGNSLPELADIDLDRISEILVRDQFLIERFSCFADSAVGNVVLKFTSAGYEVAGEYMRRPAPGWDALVAKEDFWRKKIREQIDLENLPHSFMQTITDLVFTGNKQIALELIDRIWPIDGPDKSSFLSAYEEALSESSYYSEFERQLSFSSTIKGSKIFPFNKPSLDRVFLPDF